jgi:hypothetical protein
MNKSELISKAKADPGFLNLLRTQPAKALGVKTLTPEQMELVKSVVAAASINIGPVGPGTLSESDKRPPL